MRISFIVNTLGPGGAERQLYYLARELKQKGIHCQVIYSKGKQHYIEEFEHLGVNMCYIDTGDRGKYSAYMLILKKAIKAIRAFNAEMLQSFSPATHIIATICTLVTHIPSILCERNVDIPMSVFARVVRALLYRYAYCLTCNSQAVAMWGRKQYFLPKDKIKIIPNGIDISKMPICKVRDDTQAYTILTIAQFKPQKGYRYLIQAIAEVVKQHKLVRFIFVGEGIERKMAEELSYKMNIQGFISFNNNVSDVGQYYTKANIFCLPSLSEGMPNVIMEAMAYGLAIVATKVGGILDLITDEQTGLLVLPKESQELASAMLRLLKNKSLRDKLGENAQGHIKNFSLEKCTSSYIKLYKKVIEGKCAG